MSNLNYLHLNSRNWIGMISGAFCDVCDIFVSETAKVSTNDPISLFSQDNYFKHYIV